MPLSKRALEQHVNVGNLAPESLTRPARYVLRDALSSQTHWFTQHSPAQAIREDVVVLRSGGQRNGSEHNNSIPTQCVELPTQAHCEICKCCIKKTKVNSL